jgi:hypothetical protein
MRERFVKKIPVVYFLDMTNTVFPTFQTQYIPDFSCESRSRALGFVNTDLI